MGRKTTFIGFANEKREVGRVITEKQRESSHTSVQCYFESACISFGLKMYQT